MKRRAFHNGVTKGVLSLIPNEGVNSNMKNWQPITMLAVIYKVFSITLQRRLQPILSNVINLEQIAFSPLQFILDNIVLKHENLHWAKISRQPLVFLKLDFSKAYDKESWWFLFHAMGKMGISGTFIGWVKLLFNNASARVNLNINLGE